MTEKWKIEFDKLMKIAAPPGSNSLESTAKALGLPYELQQLPVKVKPARKPQKPADPDLLSEQEVGELLGVKVGTLRAWRCAGKGPPSVKLSRTGKLSRRPCSMPGNSKPQIKVPPGLRIRGGRFHYRIKKPKQGIGQATPGTRPHNATSAPRWESWNAPGRRLKPASTIDWRSTPRSSRKPS